MLFNWIGAGALFLANAISFSGLLAVYWAWWREQAPQEAPCGRFGERFRHGVRTALGCPRYRHILANVCAVFFATIAFASLLPIFVRDVLRMDSGVFGTLMGCLGAGAVLAAFCLPHLRARVDKTHLLTASLAIYGVMLLVLPMLRSLALLVPLIVCGGMAWSATVSTMNAAAQLSFPPEVRARTLSIYLFVMAGGYTVGSLFWGRMADRFGVGAAMTAAGACLLVNAAVMASARGKHRI